MKITEIKNGIEIQKAFITKFTLTYEQFKIKYKDGIALVSKFKYVKVK